MTRVNRPFALAALLLSGCSPSAPPAELQLSESWARETVAGQTSTAAFLTIENSGGTADSLVEVTASAPATASLHSTTYADGVARMRPLDEGLEIPPGKTVVLRPGGPHIMVENLAEQLEAGETLQMRLRFLRSGERMVEVEVRNAATSGPAPQGH